MKDIQERLREDVQAHSFAAELDKAEGEQLRAYETVERGHGRHGEPPILHDRKPQRDSGDQALCGRTCGRSAWW